LKRIHKICITIFLFLLILGIYFLISYKKVYSYEQLESMPAEQLYDLFIESGLVVNERLKQHLSEEQIADILKTEFMLLSQGSIARGDTMYLDFADEVHKVYMQLTGQEN